MQHINLLDPALLARPAAQGLGAALAGLSALSLAVATHGALEWHSWSVAQQAAQQAVTAAQGQTQDPSQPLVPGPGQAPTSALTGAGPDPALAQALQAEALLAALERQSQALAKPGQLVHSITDALPATMWLTEIELRGPNQMRLAGGALAPQALAAFASQLAQQWQALGLSAPALQTVRVEPASLQADANGKPTLSTEPTQGSTQPTAAAQAPLPAATPVGAKPSTGEANFAAGPTRSLPVHSFVLATATQLEQPSEVPATAAAKP